MIKKILIVIFFIIVLIFVSLWNLVTDGYDKQNRFILFLKDIIPRSLAVSVRDTFFIIPELKYQNKLLKTQVKKYEQGLDGKQFNEKLISLKDINFKFKEFYLPFKQLDIKAGWNKLSNTFRAHYFEIIDDKVLVLSGEGSFITFDKMNFNIDKLNQKKINSNLEILLNESGYEFFGVRDILYSDEKIYISVILKNFNGFTMNIYQADYNAKTEFINFSVFFKKNEYTKKYTIQTGGRLANFKDNKILFSLGASEELKSKVQNEDNLEGKIISIDKTTNDYEILSKGHRNPQGLIYINTKDIIINSEHGPLGGDEINLNNINNTNQKIKVKNFGWPISSYGIEYDGSDPYQKSHQKFGFEEPFKYFSPSIGISQILFLKKGDKNFKNLLFVTSLRASSIYILELSENFDEIISEDRIYFNEQRIRDLNYDKDLNSLLLIFENTPSIGILKFIN